MCGVFTDQQDNIDQLIEKIKYKKDEACLNPAENILDDSGSYDLNIKTKAN